MFPNSLAAVRRAAKRIREIALTDQPFAKECGRTLVMSTMLAISSGDIDAKRARTAATVVKNAVTKLIDVKRHD